MEGRTDIRATLRRYMREQGISQNELSRRSGMAVTSINRFLTGGRDVKLETLERLIEAAGAKVELRPTPAPPPAPSPSADQSGR